MYAAGLRLGLPPADLARMSYPALANLLDASLPRTGDEDSESDERAAEQSDIDAL